MSQNGRLPDSELAAIPGGRLRTDAAAAWNAMAADAARRGVSLRPSGPRASYRTYDEQVYFWHLYQSGQGNLAAYPGTSNHGWGLAVDLATPTMRAMLDRIGAAYGWAKRWSDAPSEWWHIRWREGVWQAPPSVPPCKLGDRGARVARFKRIFKKIGYSVGSPKDTYFGQRLEKAVRQFQKSHGLAVDGVIGAETRGALLKAYARWKKRNPEG